MFVPYRSAGTTREMRAECSLTNRTRSTKTTKFRHILGRFEASEGRDSPALRETTRDLSPFFKGNGFPTGGIVRASGAEVAQRKRR